MISEFNGFEVGFLFRIEREHRLSVVDETNLLGRWTVRVGFYGVPTLYGIVRSAWARIMLIAALANSILRRLIGGNFRTPGGKPASGAKYPLTATPMGSLKGDHQSTRSPNFQAT